MDQEIKDAIDRHREEFGEFNASIYGLDFGQADVRKRLLSAIATAIETGEPISDSDIGVNPPEGALI
jgi:hypothetical protein